MSYTKNQIYFRLDTIKLALDTANETLKATALHPICDSREGALKSSYSTIDKAQRQLRNYLDMDIKDIQDYE